MPIPKKVCLQVVVYRRSLFTDYTTLEAAEAVETAEAVSIVVGIIRGVIPERKRKRLVK